jgi:hypothetical protein
MTEDQRDDDAHLCEREIHPDAPPDTAAEREEGVRARRGREESLGKEARRLWPVTAFPMR